MNCYFPYVSIELYVCCQVTYWHLSVFFFMRLSEFFMYQMDWPFHHKIACKIFSLAHLTFTVIWGVSLPVWYLEMLHVRQSKFSVISSLISTSLPRDRSPSPSAWQSGPWWSRLSSPFQKPHLCSPLEAFSSGGWTSGLSSRFGTWRGWFFFFNTPFFRTTENYFR